MNILKTTIQYINLCVYFNFSRVDRFFDLRDNLYEDETRSSKINDIYAFNKRKGISSKYKKED